jgi:hypothetical protein
MLLYHHLTHYFLFICHTCTESISRVFSLSSYFRDQLIGPSTQPKFENRPIQDCPIWKQIGPILVRLMLLLSLQQNLQLPKAAIPLWIVIHCHLNIQFFTTLPHRQGDPPLLFEFFYFLKIKSNDSLSPKYTTFHHLAIYPSP